MAFKKAASTPFGINVSDAYHRVENISIVEKTKMVFQLKISVDGNFPDFSSDAYLCDYDINGSNPIAQAYTYLKSLPEFVSAVDC